MIDLTHIISPSMPVYPGTEAPVFIKECAYEDEGFVETRLNLFSHTGTHVDAPYHLIEEGKRLEEYPLSHFTGKAFICDVPANTLVITGDMLRSLDLSDIDYFILKTGWDSKWGRDEYFENFPVMDEDSAGILAAADLKGVGVDAISVDPVDTKDFAVHKILLGSGMVIVENLKNLNEISSPVFDFYCFPLKFDDSDGAPVRAGGIFR
ncbi:cyclase family protein [Limisalsivibrio acetivorans]|uniref:cyclase family protein n=1 Tax=Limisalsivibrio acetivorans TaxID=1304888 RepID=UPI0003B665A8|nr:cyclase family protein [Limisalsivibrio acetivorans]